jgi:hypothetical protein
MRVLRQYCDTEEQKFVLMHVKSVVIYVLQVPFFNPIPAKCRMI